jgi:hypothetical protein
MTKGSAMTAPGGNLSRPVEAEPTVVLRVGRHAKWQLTASILVQSLWNPLLITAAALLFQNASVDLAAPFSLATIPLHSVLLCLVIGILVGVFGKPPDVKLDPAGWSLGRQGKWQRMTLRSLTAIDPVWSPVHGWRVRVRYSGIARLLLPTPWAPPWRKPDAAFDRDLHAVRGFVQQWHAVPLQPLRRRLSWWPLIGCLVILVELMIIGYAGVRNGVVWPGGPVIDRTPDACQALDAVPLSRHWPPAERERQEVPKPRNDDFVSDSTCGWNATDESAIRDLTLTVSRNKSGALESGTAAAIGDVRFEYELWTERNDGTPRPIAGLGDRGYLFVSDDGRSAEVAFNVANVGVELKVLTEDQGPGAERSTVAEARAVALARGVAAQLQALIR